MGRKKGGNKQQALQQQITKIQLNAMKPHISEEIERMATQVQQKLAKQQLSYVADATVRIQVLENIICEKYGYTKDDLSEMILNEEDKALEIKKVDRPAEKGDYLRVEAAFKFIEKPKDSEEEPQYGPDARFNVKNLMEEGSSHIANLSVLSEALVGMVTEQEKEIELKEHGLIARLRVNRVCEKLNQEAKQEA